MPSMAALLVPLHVTVHAKRLAAAAMRALERLLARVAMAVDLEAAGARKRLAARRAQIAVLRRRKRGRAAGRANVVVVFPGVWCGNVRLRGCHTLQGSGGQDGDWHDGWRKWRIEWQWSLLVHSSWLVGVLGRVVGLP